METGHYAQLNPVAAAVAAAVTGLLCYLAVGLPIAGMMGVGSYYGHGWMRGGYGAGPGAFGFLSISAIVMAIVISALGGAIFAWVYNAVNGVRRTQVERGPGGTSTTAST